MPTKKHRYMIVLDDAFNNQLNIIMNELKTKQRSKAIKFAIMLTKIVVMLSTVEQINYLSKQVDDIKKHL